MNQDVQTLIDGLNEDLANEYAAVIMYTYNASVLTGFNWQILKPAFEAEIEDESKHALYLSEKISILGGTPTTQPAKVEQLTDVKAMLEATMKAEEDTINRYKERIKQADKVGDIGLKVRLEDMIADETEHKEEMQRLLKDPQLNVTTVV